MKLEHEKFSENEAKSNHAVVAMYYSECPLSNSALACCCFYIATGFGGAPTGLCVYLDFKEGECTYKGEANGE
ncbi:MAG: hypothetical protein ACOYL3_16230 [Desulfuromonadaceae bacterium]